MTVYTAHDALGELLAGNRRYVSERASHPNQSSTRRAETINGQRPFAAVLGCSDSRVPPEVIFDCGLGDLFVIRVAGNIVDDVVLGSIEYAADHLHIPLILVLGHSGCGAVSAALSGDAAHGHVGSLINALQPAITQARHLAGNVVENVVKANVAGMICQIEATPLLAALIAQGKLSVQGAYYDLRSGTVEVLE